MANGLTNKQKMFVEEYLVDFNATQAAIRAGYSKKTAGCVGHENLKKPEIKEAIESRQEELLSTIKENQYRTVRQLQALVHFDIRKLYDDSGRLRQITELDDDTASALAGLDILRSTTRRHGEDEISEDVIKVKVADRIAALRLMLQVQGALNPDVAVNNNFFGIKLPDDIESIPA